jgi:mannan endo-1,4-beta-mannosidase
VTNNNSNCLKKQINLQALDQVIAVAQQNGVRLLLSLVNNWEDYGGKA